MQVHSLLWGAFAFCQCLCAGVRIGLLNIGFPFLLDFPLIGHNMRSSSSFNYKRLFVYLTVMAGVLSSAKMSGGYALAVVIPIAFAWGLSRPDRLFYAYVLSMSMVLCNDFFVPKVVAAVVVYRLMIMSGGLLGFLYIIQGRYNRGLKPFLLIFPSIGFMFISSLMSFPLNRFFIYFQMFFQGLVIALTTPLKFPLTSCQTAPIIVLNTNV